MPRKDAAKNIPRESRNIILYIQLQRGGAPSRSSCCFNLPYILYPWDQSGGSAWTYRCTQITFPRPRAAALNPGGIATTSPSFHNASIGTAPRFDRVPDLAKDRCRRRVAGRKLQAFFEVRRGIGETILLNIRHGEIFI